MVTNITQVAISKEEPMIDPYQMNAAIANHVFSILVTLYCCCKPRASLNESTRAMHGTNAITNIISVMIYALFFADGNIPTHTNPSMDFEATRVNFTIEEAKAIDQQYVADSTMIVALTFLEFLLLGLNITMLTNECLKPLFYSAPPETDEPYLETDEHEAGSDTRILLGSQII